jgi:YVTN family beta-propeller protein
VAISNPGPGLPGLVNIVDFSGDTVLITAGIGVNPQYLILGGSGSEGYTINGDGTISSFSISTSLLSSAVDTTTLLPNTNPSSIFPEGTYTYITQPGTGTTVPATVGEYTGIPPSLQQDISDIGPNPVFIAGVASAPRVYAISQGTLNTGGTPAGAGTVAAIETTTNSVSSTLPVGTLPVYGVMTADTRRAFIINHNSNNVTVINSQQNALDIGVTNGTIADPSAVGPIWADFAPTLNELVVANQGTGTSKGSVSIFSIPLCNAAALATNPNCNVNDPIDAVGFGSLVANISVGVNPTMVAVLQDGSQAFVINQADSTVSAINLVTDTVIATIPVPDTPHPTFLAVTTGSPGYPGKVYVTSSASTTMTVIRTDTDAVDTTIPLQGTGVQVRVTAP